MKEPTVEQALMEMIEAMDDGARPWRLGPSAADRIRSAYRPDFEAQLRRTAAWQRDSPKVLRLCRWAGAIAALLAETEAGPEATPAEVSGDQALVGTLAVRLACPVPAAPPGGAVVAGRWCQAVSTADAPAELLQKAAAMFAPDA